MSDERRFTLKELEQFDGKAGRPAYTAVGGIVYDVTASKMWREGQHVRKHQAGADLSGDILLAPHPQDRLDRFPRVGVLLDAPVRPPDESVSEPFLAKLMYRMHAHPASVHFPVALVVIAVLLDVIGVGLSFTGWFGGLEGAAWLCGCAIKINLVLGMALSPITIVSGLVDWKYQFDGALSRLFQWKIALSAVFVAVGILTIALMLTGGGAMYHALLWSLAPIVLATAFVGGRIVFPAG
jgi:predicted heme/steroid binding protein/uncharacterized membrane protein